MAHFTETRTGMARYYRSLALNKVDKLEWELSKARNELALAQEHLEECLSEEGAK